jgi:hypothetical protein
MDFSDDHCRGFVLEIVIFKKWLIFIIYQNKGR